MLGLQRVHAAGLQDVLPPDPPSAKKLEQDVVGGEHVEVVAHGRSDRSSVEGRGR